MGKRHPFKLRQLGDGLDDVVDVMAHVSEIEDGADLIIHFTTSGGTGRSIV